MSTETEQLRSRVAELETTIENLRASHDLPRLPDVARIAELEAENVRLAEGARRAIELAMLRAEMSTVVEMIAPYKAAIKAADAMREHLLERRCRDENIQVPDREGAALDTYDYAVRRAVANDAEIDHGVKPAICDERCARCGSGIDGPGNCLRRAEGCQGGRGESPTKRNPPTVLSARPQDADNDESIVNRHFGTPDEIAKLPFDVGREHLASRAAALILTRDLRDRVDKLEAVVRAADSLREKAAMRTLWRSEFATFDSLRSKIVLSEPKPEASDQQKTVRTPTTVNDNPHNIRRGPYLHYKGVLYWVEGLAEHADGSLLVVYRGPHNKDDHSVLSTRSLAEFTEHVETTSYSGPRFVHAWE